MAAGVRLVRALWGRALPFTLGVMPAASLFGAACHQVGFSDDSDGEESIYNAADLVTVPGLGRSPGEGNGNPLQSSCLEKSMDRGAW